MTIPGFESLPTQQIRSLSTGDSILSAEAVAAPVAPVEAGGDSSSFDALAVAGTDSSPDWLVSELEPFGSQSGFASGTGGSSDVARDWDLFPQANGDGTLDGPVGLSLPEYSQDNRDGADLLDHWGHRRVQDIVEGLSLGPAVQAAAGVGAQGLRPGSLTGAGRLLARELEYDDEVRLLGSRHGVTYGRWTGGPADTLSIEFDLSRAGPKMRYDQAFRASLERAGKAWSRRIADTWPTWARNPGDIKGDLWRDDTWVARVSVGGDGERSARLEIDVKDNDISGGFAGRGGSSGWNAPGRFWEPRFGTIQIDREYLEDAGERRLFGLLVHEIGHVIGAWTTGNEPPEHIESQIDRAAGTWTGTNVVALHGGPAPFQDADNPHDSVDGERGPRAVNFDFAHSGVCASIMSYCSHRSPRPALVPHALDFAFLADMGLTVTEETDRPETYGLAGWTDHAAFSLSVSRDLELHLPDRDVGRNRRAWFDAALDVTDRLHVEVDTFGHRSVGDLLQSFPAEDLQGTVRYAGGLLGAAINRTGLPPVTGSSSLAVDLGTLDGAASFTSLAVHADGRTETFAGGSLHYPFSLSGNEIIGSATESTLRAGFYGPRHESVAGTLHDSLVGLRASFGAARDDRPGREDVVASADYLLGASFGSGTAGLPGPGSSLYRCVTDSGCESRHAESGGWTDWATTTRSAVLAATAGWGWRNIERPHADHGFVRIARQSDTLTSGPLAPRVVESQTGTLAHAAFGHGLEWSANLATLSDGALPGPEDHFRTWIGFQGDLSGARPDASATWFGRMLGYQGGRRPDDTRFVEGLASIDFSFSDNLLDVAFSEVASRGGDRNLPDFAFENLSLGEDGTFGWRSSTSAMNGALFGPSQGEVAGMFHHGTTDVTGTFGARRVPGAAAPEERGPGVPPPPVIDLRGDSSRAPHTLHVGANAAPARDALPDSRDYHGVVVSSGELLDGKSAGGVADYLRQHIDDEYRSGPGTPGLPTLSEPPILHLAAGTSDALAAYVERAVGLINTALPVDKRILLSADPAPPLTALANVPDGRIYVDFAPSKHHWKLGGRFEYGWTDYDGNRIMVAEVDPSAEYNDAAQRWEYVGMRAGRIWFDRGVFETNLNTLSIWDWDAGAWKREVLASRPVNGHAARPRYPDEFFNRMTMYALLRSLGLLRRVDSADFPDSIVRDASGPRIGHLPNIDGEALFAAYGRLAPGTQPEDLSAESLGPWDDTSFHLRGDLDFAGGEASFGVAFRNGLARPWAKGTAPLSDLADNSALFGTASWNGALLGVTPAAETVAGDARLTVELSTLDAELEFSRLERWGVEGAPGRAGGGSRWGDGDLEYSVEIRGNSFHRNGGDDGEVAGAFFGAEHEAMGGVLERSDLAAGFGGVR